MVEVEFSEHIKGFKHFTKVNDNTWLVQKNKDSMMESYYVTILERGLVMYGDYDGVIVHPYGTTKDNIVNWMANATDLHYFCEKVQNANQHHKHKEFSSKIAKASILQIINDKFELSEEIVKLITSEDISYFSDIESDIIEKMALEFGCHQDNVRDDFKSRVGEDFDLFETGVNCYLESSFEQERDFFEKCEEMEVYDAYEYGYEDYTPRIKTQHKCLLWWAKYMLEEEKKNA